MFTRRCWRADALSNSVASPDDHQKKERLGSMLMGLRSRGPSGGRSSAFLQNIEEPLRHTTK